jgi:hypothetical protein
VARNFSAAAPKKPYQREEPMSFFGGIVSWVEEKAEDVWHGAEDAAGWVEDKAEDAWDWTKDEGVRIADGAETLFEDVKEGGKALLSDFGEGLAHVDNGLFRIFQGDFAGGAAEFGGGLAQATVGGVVDAGALLLAGGISAVQVVGHIEPVARGLRPDEIELLRGIYGNSIDYSEVRIKEGGSGLLNAGDRSRTTGNTIYMDVDSSDPSWRKTLVHEMGHVWQFQNGGIDYLSKALGSQAIGAAYQWEDAAVEERPWESLNPEDQAELLAQIHAKDFVHTGKFEVVKDGVTYDRSAYAAKVLDQVQRGLGAP